MRGDVGVNEIDESTFRQFSISFWRLLAIFQLIRHEIVVPAAISKWWSLLWRVGSPTFLDM